MGQMFVHLLHHYDSLFYPSYEQVPMHINFLKFRVFLASHFAFLICMLTLVCVLYNFFKISNSLICHLFLAFDGFIKTIFIKISC